MADVLTYVLHYEGAFNKNSLGAVSEGAARASETGGECHAVVVGGSMAGMLAARVLSDHFDKVTLLERDCFPENKARRSSDCRSGMRPGAGNPSRCSWDEPIVRPKNGCPDSV